MEINLLTKEYKEEIERARLNFKIFSTSLWIVIVVIFCLILLEVGNRILILSLKTTESQIKAEEEKIESYKEIEAKANELNKSLNLLDELKRGEIAFIPILKELSASTPLKLKISQFSLDPSRSPSLTITGSAQDKREIAKFVDKLEASSFFSKVTLSSVKTSEAEEGVVSEFNLTTDLERKK